MAATGVTLSPKPSVLQSPNPHLLTHYSHSLSVYSSSSSSISTSRSQWLFPSLRFPSKLVKPSRFLAVAEQVKKEGLAEPKWADEERGFVGIGASDETKSRARPCELYVCNLPRDYGISQLLELFKPHGTVHSVEVSRDPETGISRGCGFVTMGSIPEAKSAIVALDGSYVAGREMRVKFSVEMVSGRKNVDALNSAPKRSIVFESPYKIYVGNLSWTVKPQHLRDFFSQFGTVLSTRVINDRKRGKIRAYAFLSFSTPDEVKAAIEANGLDFEGRVMAVREVVNQEPSP
ncbi:33 kDa ribonucleoprotein, chloroplastic [Apostasia shenzhenica]|uniref:33 kDa ribonucleoprotein, chloroplastic n=1 Tax=Apostasia shenzhenica TaxID=1088818 RepID=A0A2I0ARY6_9ASPA|nr:33 kDa ribonucleoprotein, chloroplastic [Apostasia shenzhenica]